MWQKVKKTIHDVEGGTVIQIRIPKHFKEDFYEICQQKAINPSYLLRNFIDEFIKENKKEEEFKMTLTEWKEQILEEVEGEVFISCVMEEVPWHKNTKRFQVYNNENTYDKLFDITLDDDENIITIE